MNNYLLLIIIMLFWLQPAPAQPNPFFLTEETATMPLGINTPQSEAGPAMIDGILYYTAQEKLNEGLFDIPMSFYKLYAIPMHMAATANRGYPVKTLNNNFHTGPVSYCEYTGELFVTRSGSENINVKNKIFKKKKEVALKMEVYTLEDGQWVFKNNFLFNSPYHSVAQPSINAAGDTLYFVSDMPGGYGKTDIWYCVRSNGEWQPPQNAGPAINTRKHEITPFIHPDGMLYFASNKHKGQGGFDIFYARRNAQGKFTKPVNAGKKINTRSNEFGYVCHPRQPVAYFVSNKGNYRKNDDLWCLCSQNYKPEQTPLPGAEKMIAKQVQKIEEQMRKISEKMSATGYTDQSIDYNCNYVLNEKQFTPDLEISFGYSIKSDTLKSGINSYALSEYTTGHSHAVTILLQVIINQFENNLKNYLSHTPGIGLKIHTSPDAIKVFSDTRYMGEYGAEIEGTAVYQDSTFRITVSENTLINNQQLAFLRGYGIKKHLYDNLFETMGQNPEVLYHISGQKEKTKTRNQVNITFTIKNAFANY